MRFSLLVVLFATAQTTHAAPPNVILLMADDLGWADVGYLGRNKHVRTPHLDALAKRGFVFSRFYAAAPVCSPTRGSVITGRHPSRYGIDFANDGHLPESEVTLSELLKKQGYRTGHFGKWHLGTLTKTVRDANRGGPRGAKHYSPPWEHSFDVCFSTESKVPTFDPLLRPKGIKRRTWWNPAKDKSATVNYGTAYWNEQGKAVTENTRGDDSRVIMDRVLPFVDDSAKRNNPFFAVVWFHTPHLPVVADAAHRKPYATLSEYAQNYFGCIQAMDEQIGRLVAHLKSRGLDENTILWFCSDNGPEGKTGKAPGSAQGLRGRKRSLYEGGIRVPGILVWPRLNPDGKPRAISAPAGTSDILPTIAGWCGVPKSSLPKKLDGINLLPVLTGKQKSRGSPIGFHSRNTSAWIGDRYKLVATQNRFELYDLENDMGEKRNIADSHPELLRKMKTALAQWRADCLAERKRIVK